MKTKYLPFFAIIFTLVMINFANSCAAQARNLTYSIAKKPDWVVEKSYDPDGLKDNEYGNAPYLLYTYQVKLTDNDLGRYTRQTRRIDNVEGAESASQLTIDFDPTFQKLIVHDITVTRNGVKTNRLNKKTFELYKVETDADRLIYNGTVTASTVLENIRAGDIIDYSYSVNGKTPYFKGAIGSFQRLQYGVPVDRHYLRIMVPNDRPYQTRLYEDGQAPKVFEEGNFKIFEWDFKQQAQLDVDANTPYWHVDYPYFQISDKIDWADVGRWKSDLYGPATNISQELQIAIDEIKASNNDKESRTAATLKFVQREIRYLGIEIGDGGYVPRDPSKVYARRFGDCKDKTRLMVTMLNRMDISANALLVHSNQLQGIDIYLPSLSAFDHVITHVRIGEKSYYLDPTKGEQIGALQTLEQSYYGKGVEVTPTSNGLIDVSPATTFPYQLDTIESFGFDTKSKTVTLNVTTKHYGDKADSLLRWKNNKGPEAISKNYLEHYQKTYPTIKVKEPIRFETDVDKSLVTIFENYEIIDAWQQDADEKPNFNLTFEAVPTSISGSIPDLNKKPRTLPLAMKHPIHIRHQLKFTMPEGWAVDTDSLKIDNDSFQFEKSEIKKGSIYTETYIYNSKKDHITPENLQAAMKDVEKIDDNWGVNFTSGNQYQSAAGKRKEATTEFLVGLAVILGVIIYIGLMIFGLIKATKYDEPWRAEGVFYPMALWKFLLLTTLSLGIYVTFWFFKNWQWLRIVRGKKILAFMRALFYPFMSFALFNHMTKENQAGLKWFWAISIPIGILLLLSSVIDAVTESWNEAPFWLSLITYPMVFVLVPAVMHVNAMNDKDGTAYRNNSRITWHSVLFIAMTLPLAGMIIFDMFTS